MEAMSDARRGLGRGLASIIPLAPVAAASVDTESIESTVERLVRLGFDLLESVAPVALCGYLHRADGAGPRLAARGAVDAEDLFDLARSLSDALDDPRARSVLIVGGRPAISLRTEGPRSHGVHVVVPAEGWFEGPALVLAEAVCRSIGEACHLLESQGAPGAEDPRTRGAGRTGGDAR